MKRIVLNLGFSFVMIFLLSSCLDDGHEVYVSYGEIRNWVSNNNYEILTDEGKTLAVMKSNSFQEIEDGKRVLANFEILSDRESDKNVYEVKVLGFYNLLSKPLVTESFIREDEDFRRDSIGNDPYKSIYAWFGGDYINIDFEIYFDRFSNEKHLINLVYDNTKTLADTIYLSLYQNSCEKKSEYKSDYERGWGRCSFKLSDLLPAGVDSKPVKLTWREYGYGFEVIERSDSGIFTKGAHSESKGIDAKTGFDNSLTLK